MKCSTLKTRRAGHHYTMRPGSADVGCSLLLLMWKEVRWAVVVSNVLELSFIYSMHCGTNIVYVSMYSIFSRL